VFRGTEDPLSFASRVPQRLSWPPQPMSLITIADVITIRVVTMRRLL
jgi:hypothetical protein